MKTILKTGGGGGSITALGFLLGVLLLAGTQAFAAPPAGDTVTKALTDKKLDAVRGLLSSDPQKTDEIIKALLKATQQSLAKDPDFSGQMMSLAGEHAEGITPPSVPAICADLRRIVEEIPIEQIGTPLYQAVLEASQSFANAPVVVAQGRPNLCEEALLAQTPGMRVRISTQKHPPYPDPKPSAD